MNRRALLLLMLLLCSVAHRPALAGAKGKPAKAPAAYRTYRDPSTGIRLEIPAGWRVTKDDGFLTVTKEKPQAAGILIIPARVNVERTPQNWLDCFFQVARKNVREDGGDLHLLSYRPVRGGALASIEGMCGGVHTAGIISISCQPGFVDMKMLYAPAKTVERDMKVLVRIAESYRRDTVVEAPQSSERGAPASGGGGARAGGGYVISSQEPVSSSPSQAYTAPVQEAPPQVSLQPWQGRYFSASLPPGWQVAEEGTNSVTLLADDHSMGVSAIFLMRLSYPPDLYQASYQQFSSVLRNLSLSAPRSIASPTGSGEWVVFGCEAIDAYGRPARGRIFAGREWNSLGHVYVGQLELAQAERWPACAELLAAVRSTVAVSDASSAATLGGLSTLGNRPNDSSGIIASGRMRDAATSRSSQQWHNAMSGTARVYSPSLGTEFTTSESRYWSTGPDGPGYYRTLPGGQGYEKLQEVR